MSADDLPELRDHIRSRRAALAGFMEQGCALALEADLLRVIPRNDIYIRYLSDNRASIGELASEFYGRKLRVEVSLNGAGAATAATTDAAGRGGDAAESAAPPRSSPKAPPAAVPSSAPKSSEPVAEFGAKQRSNQMRAALTADRAEILRAVKLIAEPGGVHEIRALNVKGAGATASGYFNSTKPVIDAVLRLDAEGIYITLNATDPALLARSKNAVKAYAKHTTSDADILSRRWLPLDFDPRRPTAISSTDAEHEAAIERAKQAREFLTARQFPEPILADSGNGAHLLYRIAEPNDGETAALCKRVQRSTPNLPTKPCRSIGRITTPRASSSCTALRRAKATRHQIVHIG
jgi:hypothetical protein